MTTEKLSKFITWVIRNYKPMETIPQSEIVWIPKVPEKVRRMYDTEELVKIWKTK
jgi:hypothetical protein